MDYACREERKLAGPYPKPYGRYVLLERLATGGMSQIELARSAVEEAGFVRLVVIKRMKVDRQEDAAFVRMFMDEARITAELHHANVAQVYDFGRIEDSYFLALEYVPGLDLRSILVRLGERGLSMPTPMMLRVMADMLDGLAYAHERIDTFGRRMNIVHRDVNPRNIMVSARGEVKLIDFGVAKAADRLEKTATHVVKGKIGYMAPEQFEGGPVDQRADVFAAGLTLYELIAGTSPFFGLSEVQVMNRLINQPLPDPPVPASFRGANELLAVYRKAVARDSDGRYPDARALRDALLAVAGGEAGLASREELAAYLKSVDPDLQARISGTVSRYAGTVDAFDGTIAGPPEVAVTEEFDPHDPVSAGSVSLSLTRPQIVIGGVAVAGLGVLGGALVAVVLVVLVVVFAWPREVSEPAPVEPLRAAEDTARPVDGLDLAGAAAVGLGIPAPEPSPTAPGGPTAGGAPAASPDPEAGAPPAGARDGDTEAEGAAGAERPGEPPTEPVDPTWARPASDLKGWE